MSFNLNNILTKKLKIVWNRDINYIESNYIEFGGNLIINVNRFKITLISLKSLQSIKLFYTFLLISPNILLNKNFAPNLRLL